MDKKLLKALRGETITPPPIWLMRQAGRYLPEYRRLRTRAGSFLDLCFNPDLAAEVTLQPIRRFDFDAAIIFADILLIPFALGQDLKFIEGEGPKLPPLKSVNDLAKGLQQDRLEPVYAALRKTRDALPPDKALIGFCGAPWTVACYMIEGSGGDFIKARNFARDKREDFLRLLDILAESSAQYLCRQIEAGADALQIFDSWAGLVDADDFADFIVNPTKKIVAAVQGLHPDIPIIGFPRGSGERYRIFARESGINAVSLDQTISLDFAALLQADLPVQGNLAPEILVQGGAVMKNAVQKILEKLGNSPFIFNLGHGITPDAPIAHVTELVQRVRGQ